MGKKKLKFRIPGRKRKASTKGNIQVGPGLPGEETQNEDDIFGDSIIKPTSFYSGQREKTKLNWFLFELALNFESYISRHLAIKLIKYKIEEREIADFSIHLAREMKEIILQKLSGEIEDVYFSYEMIESYFPRIKSEKLIDEMLDVLAGAWVFQLDACGSCPTRCLTEKDHYCTMFDTGP
jgi:hypothetical protein